MRQQLQAAEDTARERETSAAAAAERATAAHSLIGSLRARAVAAEAEAKPLRAQLAELADTLDVKVSSDRTQHLDVCFCGASAQT